MNNENTSNIPRDPARGSLAFVAVKTIVMRGSARVAVAVSHTMARRIAKALNRYKVTPKGY